MLPALSIASYVPLKSVSACLSLPPVFQLWLNASFEGASVIGSSLVDHRTCTRK